MADLKNYGLDNLFFSFNGIPFGLGGSIQSLKIAQASNGFEDEVGSGGEVVRIKKLDGRASVTLTLTGYSSDNLILSALHEADLLAPNGVGVGILFAEQGNDKFMAAKAWIQKAPDRDYAGDKIGDCEWVFRCADLVRIDGGN